MIEQPPILITGCARSGTSLVAGAVFLCGAFGGEGMQRGNRFNAKGMFENAGIRNSIVKKYLREQGLDPKGQHPLPRLDKIPIPDDWRQQVERVMLQQGYEGGSWFYKGAKICLMWPVWHQAFPNARWVIVRRRTPDIVRSCFHTKFMNAFDRSRARQAVGAKDAREGWLWWVHQHEQRFVEMMDTGLNVREIWPERMVQGDYRQLFEIVNWLGLEWSSKVLGFIDPRLWKARRK